MKPKIIFFTAAPLLLLSWGCGSKHYTIEEKTYNTKTHSAESWVFEDSSQLGQTGSPTFALFSEEPPSIEQVDSFNSAFIDKVHYYLKTFYYLPTQLNYLQRGTISFQIGMIEFRDLGPQGSTSGLKPYNIESSPSSKDKTLIQNTSKRWNQNRSEMSGNIGINNLLITFYSAENKEIGHLKLKSTQKKIRPKDAAIEINNFLKELRKE